CARSVYDGYWYFDVW
nr:immunoglobulin heavy chain junction region [Mus musculus]MBK4196558.1 immunoglobulin heavy chain junction region [Mus musculus]MBK4196559.1 immunoglobulin heavy chain junction region [Mus musculus]